MKIAVTGANGYIGRNVVRELIKRNHQVVSILFPGEDVHPYLEGAEVIRYDLLKMDNSEIEKEFRDCDALLHLAWQAGFNHQDPCHIQNVIKHYNFITSVYSSGVKHISVAGTMHEVGYHVGPIDADTPCNPLNPYGIAKNFLRQSLVEHSTKNGLNLQWLRFYYITGDDKYSSSIFTKILKASEEGKKKFPLNSGEMLYDFIDIKELALQISTSLESNAVGIYNCCSGKPKSLRTAVVEFIEKNNLDIEPEFNVFPERPYDSMAVWGVKR
ncbi:NAD(P)-dependent oxidoreductase [Moritella sp. 28]|uniref:NAD-dependent epimerase/dehydratase family protein n=1 Tax=Moritella sp. 28 TaxID=2746232 RepID=UPI001BAB485D|nr:NAD(P)-dependent oxidoreductase [Moritella sp. 28]QUM83560.1 NAD(P)-dependent oxidoreductase [Moritella sp. 28]